MCRKPLELIKFRESVESEKCFGDKKFRFSSSTRRGVRDVEAAGSNPVIPIWQEALTQSAKPLLDFQLMPVARRPIPAPARPTEVNCESVVRRIGTTDRGYLAIF